MSILETWRKNRISSKIEKKIKRGEARPEECIELLQKTGLQHWLGEEKAENLRSNWYNQVFGGWDIMSEGEREKIRKMLLDLPWHIQSEVITDFFSNTYQTAGGKSQRKRLLSILTEELTPLFMSDRNGFKDKFSQFLSISSISDVIKVEVGLNVKKNPINEIAINRFREILNNR
jgi:hypothetical protein